MRTRLIVLLGLLLACAPAEAGVQLFWSTTGLADPGMTYSTALTDFRPIVRPLPVDVLIPGSYDLFLWGRFIQNNDPNDPNYLPMYSAVIGADLAFQGDAQHGVNVAYRHKWGTSPGQRRWDGSAGIALDGVMAAIGACGIRFTLPGDPDVDLYFSDTHEFLVGATQATGLPGQRLTMVSDGLAIYYPVPPGEQTPPLVAEPATVTFVPEPGAAGLVLVALSGLRRLQR
jgi:hypothetical protein